MHLRSRIRTPISFARALLVIAALLVTAGSFDAPVAATASNSLSIGAGLRGPSGLHATVYATKLRHLSALTTDLQGRVWAATAAAADNGTDAVYVISEAGATPRRVVSGVHTPLGLLWLNDALYVSRRGGVDRYTGFDGSLFTGMTTVVSFPDGVGELNGIAYSSEGRLAVGISAPCDHCTPTSKWSASVVTFLPDGSDLRVMASGVRAAVGLVYYPNTSTLFASMNQRDDLGSKTPRDWLAVVADGQHWGFPACYGQGGAACVGVPRPTASLARHAAVSGVAIATGQLGRPVGTAAVVAEWATGRVQMVSLQTSGSTYRGTAQAFLMGFKNPMPVYVDAAGALFVGDWTTGTIYRIAA